MIEWEPEIGSTDPLKSSTRPCQTQTSSTLVPTVEQEDAGLLDFEAEFKAKVDAEVKQMECRENDRRSRIWLCVKKWFLKAWTYMQSIRAPSCQVDTFARSQ